MAVDRCGYLVLAAVTFAVEAAIAVFFQHGFIRERIGDFLIVVLLYCLLMGISRLKPIIAGAIVFAFACAVETAQALGLDERLGLGGSVVGDLTLGSTFDWGDIAAYAAGVIAVLVAERIRRRDARSR